MTTLLLIVESVSSENRSCASQIAVGSQSMRWSLQIAELMSMTSESHSMKESLVGSDSAVEGPRLGLVHGGFLIAHLYDLIEMALGVHQIVVRISHWLRQHRMLSQVNHQEMVRRVCVSYEQVLHLLHEVG